MGRVGHLYRRLLHEDPRWQLTATADPHTEADYADYRELLSSQVEAVIIATPPETHYRIARETLEAGKDALVEKPPARTVDECEQLARLAAACDRVLFFAYHARYNGAVEQARRMLADQDITRIDGVYKENAFRYHDRGSWVLAEGVLRDSGINAISVITAILPPLTPLQVTAATLVASENLDGAITQGSVELVFGSSNTARLEMDWLHRGEEIRRINVQTTEHRYCIDVVTDSLSCDGLALERDGPGGGQLDGEYERMLDDFLRRTRTRRSLTSTVELRIIETAHRIAETGRR